MKTTNYLIASTPTLSSVSSPSSSYVDEINRDRVAGITAEEHRKVAFIGIENFYKDIKLPEFDLKQLLEKTPLGPTIISYYSKNNNLNDSKLNLLT